MVNKPPTPEPSYQDLLLDPNNAQMPDLKAHPVLYQAFQAVKQRCDAPDGMLFNSMLSAISAACQGILQVIRPGLPPSPVSLYTLTVAVSGERKSTVDDQFKKAILKFESEYDRKNAEKIRTVKLEHDNWKYKLFMLKKEFVQLDKDQETVIPVEDPREENGYRLEEVNLYDHYTEKIIEHEENEPKLSKSFCFFYADVTVAGLVDGIRCHYPTANLYSAEGHQILNGHALRGTGSSLFNKLWSGERDVINRKGESIVLENVSFGASIQIQPAMLDKHMRSKGSKDLIDDGFWARFLVQNPESRIGFRQVTLDWDQPMSVIKKSEHLTLDFFDERMSEILDLNLQMMEGSDRVQKIAIEFDRSTRYIFQRICNHIEALQRPGAPFANVKGMASKLGENIARVAALIEYFEKGSCIISYSSLKTAVHYCFSCCNHYRNLFDPEYLVEKYYAIYLDIFNRKKTTRCFSY